MPEVGKVLTEVTNNLPYWKIIGSPLNAAMSAQTAASKQFADFMLATCINEDGTVKNITFKRDEDHFNDAGVKIGTNQREIQVPLMAMIELPNVILDTVSVDFELELSDSYSNTNTVEAGGSAEAHGGWGGFGFSAQASFSMKNENVRKTDTRARQKIHVSMSKAPAPEGLAKVLDYLVNDLKTVTNDTTNSPATPAAPAAPDNA